jgi:hypothetical protein
MIATEEQTETRIATALDEEGHVYVHVSFTAPQDGAAIRIWSTTFLTDHHSAHESRLVHAENISYAPQWTLVAPDKTVSFLLIFKALPRTCAIFDLIERIPQPGGFEVRGIVRNETDVYHTVLT